MIDFENIRNICEKNTKRSEEVIDNFLIPYATEKNHLAREFNMRLKPYQHVVGNLQQDWISQFNTQYIAHRLFKNKGLINKYINHSYLQKLTTNDLDYLGFQVDHPWRFSFSEILSNPSEDFYLMMDVFTSDTYLLFSPGITKILYSQQVLLWFNLIGYNGVCWQSFGPMIPYSGFESDDIFYFATTLNPDIETEEDLCEDLENNPVPYMMLVNGSTIPPVFHKNDQVVFVVSEFDTEEINTKSMQKDFKIEYNQGVYRLTLKRWGDHPHFCTVYYDENEKLLILSSMTDRGYNTLVNRLKEYGLELPEEPYIRVSPSMLSICSKLFGTESPLDEYESLFTKESNETDNKEVEKLNTLLGMYIDEINSGQNPNIEMLAKKTGIDPETAKEVIDQVNQKFNEMKKRNR